MIHETKDPKLIDGSVEHFERNPSIKEMFVSEDGQYFFSVSRSNYWCKTRGLKLYRIMRSQLPKPEAKTAKAVKTEPAEPEISKEPRVVPPAKKKAPGTKKEPSKPK